MAQDPEDRATGAEAPAAVQELARNFADQVERALELPVPNEVAGLALVDHYLAQARDEEREPILTLLAAGAGAWLGELVREIMGATWIGVGENPYMMRLLLAPAYVHFAPAHLALEAIIGGPLREDDPRAPEGVTIDSSFGLRTKPQKEREASDHDWLAERLDESAALLPEDQFHSLTGRFESLELVVQLLVTRAQERGDEPRPLTVDDYVAALAG